MRDGGHPAERRSWLQGLITLVCTALDTYSCALDFWGHQHKIKARMKQICYLERVITPEAFHKNYELGQTQIFN